MQENDSGVVQALSGIKEAVEAMLESMARTTQTFILVGDIVSRAWTPLQYLPEKISKVVRSSVLER